MPLLQEIQNKRKQGYKRRITIHCGIAIMMLVEGIWFGVARHNSVVCIVMLLLFGLNVLNGYLNYSTYKEL